MNNKKGSLIKWAGSKARSANQIIPHLNFDCQYIEPFCGSATFFFRMQPADSHLNDTNPALISFYEEVAADPLLVWTYYSSIDVDEGTYYLKRREFNELEGGATKAALFLYLNHYGFNGLFRTNLKGELNTPFGARDKVKKKMSLDEISEFSAILKTTKFSCADFENFLEELSPEGACIYMDPPYFTNDDRVFGEYGANTFKGRDLKRLLEVAERLAVASNTIAISYTDCTEFRELFGKYIVSEINVQRNVGGFAGRRKIDKELVAVLAK